MIRIPKSEDPPKKVLASLLKSTLVDGKMLSEIEAARFFYAKVPVPKKSFDFKRYKEEEVCFELDSLFYGKCAYCESLYSAVDSRDIEHFRPKGGVTGVPVHNGYWWLAATWSNLLVSCPACNQHRKQAVYKIGMTGDEIEAERRKTPVARRGKGCHFPLLDEATRAANESDILRLEVPLLINPTTQNPKRHFEWVFDWDRSEAIWDSDSVIAHVVPKTIDGAPDPFGVASISIFGLDRLDLFRARVVQLRQVQSSVSSLFETLQDMAECESEEKMVPLQDRLRKKRARLKQLCSRKQAYTAMTRAFVRLAFFELKRLTK